MNRFAILTAQTQDAYSWANRLLESIPQQRWDTTPATIDSNITWQAGHLIVSIYYHSIMVIAGHQMDILQKIPLKEYDGPFTSADPKNAIGRIDPGQFWWHLCLMEAGHLRSSERSGKTTLTASSNPASFPTL